MNCNNKSLLEKYRSEKQILQELYRAQTAVNKAVAQKEAQVKDLLEVMAYVDKLEGAATK